MTLDSGCDIVTITESFLEPDSPLHIHAIPDYKLLNHDRAIRKGGGAAINSHESYRVKMMAVSPCPYVPALEYMIAEITLGTSKLFLSVVYRPPDALPMNVFFDVLAEFLLYYEHEIVTGYFNIDFLSSTSS